MRIIRSNPGFQDVAAWHFSPETFRDLLDLLALLGLSPFRVERIYSTLKPKAEFYAVLRIAA
jgi:hypothetical protein